MTNEPNLKTPRLILPGIYAFSPNRETLGGTAYLIVENTGNILVDCPLWNEVNQQFLLSQGGVSCLYLTHRGGIGKQVKQMQGGLNCQVVIQEQEAYLLPNVLTTTFEQEIELNENLFGFWTSGHSPGSSCLYYKKEGGILFTGRHLLPDPQGKLLPLRWEKTFHWPRQLKNVQLLRSRFLADSLSIICPGANTGYLRGKGYLDQALERLQNWQLTQETSH